MEMINEGKFLEEKNPNGIPEENMKKFRGSRIPNTLNRDQIDLRVEIDRTFFCQINHTSNSFRTTIVQYPIQTARNVEANCLIYDSSNGKTSDQFRLRYTLLENLPEILGGISKEILDGISNKISHSIIGIQRIT